MVKGEREYGSREESGDMVWENHKLAEDPEKAVCVFE